jgi:potassium/hydrogen antiporter
MRDANLTLIIGGLLVAGLLATMIAGRLRVPGLVLFIGLGMAIGSDSTGWIDFGADPSDYELARTIGVIALALILFEGGLSVGFREVRPVVGASVALAVLGTMITAAIAGVAASWLFGLSTLEGLLLGAIVSVTDGAAIFGLLRDSSLRPRVARTLEAEAGMNDPVAILLVVGLIDWIELPDYGLEDMALLFVQQLAIGLVVGVAIGWLAVQGLRRAWLGSEAGYAIGTVGVAAIAFGAAQSLDGSGFLAVYIAGLWLGTVPIPAKRAVTLFHQGLALVAQVTTFVVLGLLVFPSQLGDIAIEGTLLAIVLVFVARPVATFVCATPARFPAVEQVVLAWAGLRGALPVVLATFPVIDEVPGSLEFFNIVFFAVLLSTLLQGATFEPFAKALGVTSDQPPTTAEAEAHPLTPASARAQILTVRPWGDADGDPAYPSEIFGIPVTAHLLTRLDRPGALVGLADGRYAFTGPVLGVGSATDLQGVARRRLERASSDTERAWWREIIGALAR